MPSNRSLIFWLQSIYHINFCRKPSFINVSLILTLTVQATLSLVQVSVDSVNFKVHTCNFKNKQIYHYSLMEETVKLHQLPTSFQVNLEVCLKEFWKCVLLTKPYTHLQPGPSTSTQLISTSSQLHPPPPSWFQPPPSSLQHPQQYSNQNIARNWAISLNLSRKIESSPFWLKIGSHGILEVLIPNPDLDFWNPNPKMHFWANLGRKSQSCPFSLKMITHGFSRMLLLIPTIIFWSSNRKIHI